MNQSNLTDISVCAVLHCSRPGVRRSVDTDEIEVNADKDMLYVGKDILISPELRAVGHLDDEAREYLRHKSTPSPLFHSGVYLVAIGLVTEINAKWEELSAERKLRIKKFLDNYPQRVKEAKAKLKGLFDPSDYPPPAALKAAFQFKLNYIQFGPAQSLKKISAALFEQERKKTEIEWQVAAAEVTKALRTGLNDLVQGMLERLGAEEGKPKQFREAYLVKMHEFLDSFEKRNLTSDEELAKLVTKARTLLTDKGVDQLKADKERERVVQGFSSIRASLDKMIEVKPSRKIRLGKDV